MTDEQELKARLALLMKAADYLQKSSRAEHHLKSVKATTLYNLPYRVYYKYEYEPNEVKINPFYPHIGIDKAHKYQSTFEERMKDISVYTDELDAEGRHICKLDPAIYEEKKNKYEYQFRMCRTDTEEGFRNWKRYFVKFLLPYEEDMKKWGAFEFFGNVNHTQEEVEEAKEYYLNLIDEYKKNPEAYVTEKIYISQEDMENYIPSYTIIDDVFREN